MLRPCVNPKTWAVELLDLENDNISDSVVVYLEKEANAQSVDTQWNIRENVAPTKQQASQQLQDEENSKVQNAIAKNKTTKKK